jgi:hypothetical protein
MSLRSTSRADGRAAALARRIGMEWTGDTGKYCDLRLNMYRPRPDDL